MSDHTYPPYNTHEKYVVFKKEDWDLMKGQATPIPDCVVIRLQDVFATSALYTYANEISTSLEVLEKVMGDLSFLPSQAAPVVERLEQIRDYFAQMGDASKDYEWKKVPD